MRDGKSRTDQNPEGRFLSSTRERERKKSMHSKNKLQFFSVSIAANSDCDSFPKCVLCVNGKLIDICWSNGNKLTISSGNK